MAERLTDDDLELLGELGVEIAPDQPSAHSAREQRIIAGFEEIERFVETHGRLPQHGEAHDIFERLYAVRLERLRASEECRHILMPRDSRGLLAGDAPPETALSDAALLAALGSEASAADDITRLVHVRSRTAIKAAEEIAQRSACKDFALFKPIFDNVQRQLATGERETVKYQDNALVEAGHMFILGGQKLIVAEMGELFIGDHGRPDRRLRVVYENATESDILLRSLQRALNKDKASRRITKADYGPLFSAIATEDDLPTGYIYVLRSNSADPFIVQNRAVIHKIGVTAGDVKSRIANARTDPTYLLAEVEIVATFKLANINRKKFETLLQQFFSSARLDLALQDRFGSAVKPREWFLVPLDVIEEVIERIKTNTIDQFQYDPTTANLLQT
ncbi:GIY-YIG nuclease family protein [Candidatus Viridilinea mediisalina]|uniref:GIY-YIG nuclease family protein n=1 Tax=Candidatus Viridilinea mediisalina TaxID=2024553 RepID=UPI001C2C5DEA|nr:GIY-YIG nuclease family protein [Candidatus Viridilinea mediisalina]